MLLALWKVAGVVAPMYMWEQWQSRCKLHKLLFQEAAQGTRRPLMASEEVLAGRVDDGCITNLVHGGCHPATGAAIVADPSGWRQTPQRSLWLVAREGGHDNVVIVVDIDGNGGGVEGSRW